MALRPTQGDENRFEERLVGNYTYFVISPLRCAPVEMTNLETLCFRCRGGCPRLAKLAWVFFSGLQAILSPARATTRSIEDSRNPRSQNWDLGHPGFVEMIGFKNQKFLQTDVVLINSAT